MPFSLPMSLIRRVSFLGCVALLAAGLASAQSAGSQDTSSSPGFSSSQAGLSASGLQLAEFALPEAPDPAGSASGGGAGSGAGQYGGSYAGKKGFLRNWTFEAGAGFNAPQSTAITYGGQFTLGAGLKFNRYLSGLIEYQFMDDKLPGYLIAETGANGGYAHIWSFTLAPVIDLTPKAANGIYVTGGGGFYRKVTSFTNPEEEEYCYYFCEVGVVPTVVGHFSSNQGGFNAGVGFYHRVGGQYGDSNTKLFIEGRYLEVLTPASVSNPNGLGTTAVSADTKVIPVTLGVRF